MYEGDEQIKDAMTGRVIGTLRHKANGDVYAIHYTTGRILGYYRASDNTTYDYTTGRRIAIGNIASALVWESR